MNKEKSFAIRLAGFTAVGMSFAVGVPTFLDSRLSSHCLFGAREYPLGYWILLIGPILFFGMYFLLVAPFSSKKRMILSLGFFVVIGCLSLLNFFPEFPHGNVTLYMLLYFIGDILSLWAHYKSITKDYINSTDILDETKLEMTKELICFWRTTTVSVGVGYIAIVVQWSNSMLVWPAKYLTDQTQQALAAMICAIQIVPFSLFFIFCPILEGVGKWQEATQLFCQIKKPVVSGQSGMK